MSDTPDRPEPPKDPMAFADDEARELAGAEPAALQPPPVGSGADPMAFADAEVHDLAAEKAKRRQRKISAPVSPGVGQGKTPLSAGAYRPRPLPDGCPVIPLGMSGSTRWYLDARGQLQGLPVSRHVKLDIQGLFCDQAGLVLEYWTRINKETGKPDGWHPERAALDLLTASGAKLWSPSRQVRGRGCWLDEKGGLVVHAGDAVLYRGEWRSPGTIDGMVYLAGEPIMRPAAIDVPDQLTGPGQVLLDLFGKWHFRRQIDRRLLIGMFAANLVGGALQWRPAMWFWGDAQTGKSTLGKTFELLSGGALLTTEDTTAAGVWQLMGYDSLPVAIDEAADDVEPRRAIALLRLIRVLTGGGKITRGGADHAAREFMLSACVTCSSITRPAMLPQDISRIVSIQLLPPENPLPQPMPEVLRRLGAQIFQRIVDAWPRWQPVFDRYIDALKSEGCADRPSRNYATLLALAHVVLSDEAPEVAAVKRQVRQIARDLKDEAAEALTSGQAWLRYTLSRTLPLDGVAEKKLVHEWIKEAAQLRQPKVWGAPPARSEEVLAQIGILLRRPKSGAVTAIALANTHSGLIRIYEGTPWAGAPGRKGGWIDAARSLPGAESCQARFLGDVDRGTSIPLDVVLGKGWEKDVSASEDEAISEFPDRGEDGAAPEE